MAMMEHTTSLEYHILLQNTSILAKKKSYHHHHLQQQQQHQHQGSDNNMKKDDRFSCSRSWKPFIHTPNEGMKAGPLSKDMSTVTELFPWLSQGTALKTDSPSSLSLTDGLSGSSFMVSPVRDSPVFCS
jgi:hypothetical protein